MIGVHLLIFELPGKKQQLVFAESVLKTFYQNRQVGFLKREAGGQLFARIQSDIVEVVKATGPHKKDFRKRFGFVPNKKRLKNEIIEYFDQGLHYVGDWHSHPQKIPKPSMLDIRSMKQCFRQSNHELDHFILVVVRQIHGTPLWVGAINSTKVVNLKNYARPAIMDYKNAE